MSDEGPMVHSFVLSVSSGEHRASVVMSVDREHERPYST